MCDKEPQADIKTRSWAKKVRARQIQKLIRDIRILESKRLASIDSVHTSLPLLGIRGTEKQLEKNKRRVERLQRKLEALRRLSVDHVCGLVTEEATEETTSWSTTISAVEQAIAQAVTSDTKYVSSVEQSDSVKISHSAVLPFQGIGGGAQYMQYQVTLLTSVCISPPFCIL